MKIIYWVIVIIFFGVVVSIAVCKPELLVENDFLKSFINHEIVNILALIMTVTTASVANIHLAFNRTEEAVQKLDVFIEARKEVNESAFWLIGLFIFSVIVLIIRSYFKDSLGLLAFFNGLCLWILLINMLVLIDITSTIFAIHPHVLSESAKTNNRQIED